MGSNPLIMKYLLFAFYLLTSCGNKKAEIVELIKKTKNEWYEASMKSSSYSYAASKLLAYNIALSDSKKYGSQQMKDNAQMYKKSYEKAIQDLKGVPSDILNNQRKLDSIAYKWAFNADDLKRRIDSLELELKKH
jgi:hypothetical protein